MTSTRDEAVSEAARQLIARRWGSQVVERAAQVVISRVAELPPAVRAQVHEATEQKGAES
jgi:hypothetical protein